MRSQGWRSQDDAPRPIPFPGTPAVSRVPAARLVAVVPVLGHELAAAVEPAAGPWWDFLNTVVDAQAATPDQVGVFPLLIDPGADQGKLGDIFSKPLRIAEPSPFADPEPAAELRCRDLAQGIAQLGQGGDVRLRVFISHTKRTGEQEGQSVGDLIGMVRGIIGETRLGEFFDTNDLQPGRDWEQELRNHAAKSALLVVRTDLYASRAWCQREMLIAKHHGVPIVILDALNLGEERGSFLMDHVPRIPVRSDDGNWSKVDIRRGLNLLVDECLKRVLWRVQETLAVEHSGLTVDWWAPHAPEPVTLAQWIEASLADGSLKTAADQVQILHPDPPLGPDEQAALQQMATLIGGWNSLDVTTPRTLAARGV